MVSDINFGSLSNIGGKTVTSGSASGLDTETLINSLIEARRLPAVALEDDITINNAQITAYQSFEEIVQRLKDSFNALRNPTGFGASADNAFESRQAFTSTNDGSTAANFVGVSANDDAAIGKYTFEVTQLAQGAIFQTDSGSGFASRDTDIVEAGILSAGNFDINGQTVTVDDDDSLDAIVSKINLLTDDTNVQASVLKISDSDFRLVLTSTKTGTTDGGITLTDTDNVFANNPISQIQGAQQAQLNYKVGLTETTISRDTNTIDDFVDNVTITLFETTPTDTEITVDVDEDVQEVSTAIVEFINAYNDFRVFNAQQNEVDADGNFLDSASLNSSTLLDNTVNAIFNILSESVNSPIQEEIQDSNSVTRLGDLGISFGDFSGDSEQGIPLTTSILEVDVGILTSKLQSDFDDVRKLFELSFSSDSTNLNILDSGSINSEETLSITVAGGATVVVTAIDGHNLTSSASLTYDTADERVTSGDTPGLVAILKGQVGTGLEGAEIFYYGSGDETIESSIKVDSGNKNYTINVDHDSTEDGEASLTHIRGLQLASAIDLDYSKDSTGFSGSISGANTNLFGGLELLYIDSGGGAEDITFSVQQGVGDVLFNSVADLATGDSTGAIRQEIASIQTSNENLQESIDRIDRQIASYRERLLDQFGALEAAIAASESILQLLSAQSDARNNS